MKTFNISKDFSFEFTIDLTFEVDLTLWDLFEPEYSDHMKATCIPVLVNDSVVLILENWTEKTEDIFHDAINECLYSIYTTRDETFIDGELFDFYYYIKTILLQPFEVGEFVVFEKDIIEQHMPSGLIIEKTLYTERFGEYYTYDLLCEGEIIKDVYFCKEMVKHESSDVV